MEKNIEEVSNLLAFGWPEFFSREIGFDWEKNLLSVLDVQADIVIAEAETDSSSGAPFLISIMPEELDRLEETSNNFEAVIRKMVGTMYPRGIEKLLTDGTKVIELVPDPQAGETTPYKYNNRDMEKLWQWRL